MSKDQQPRDDDPRSVSDKQLREQYSKEEVQSWRDSAKDKHRAWIDVLKNNYGKD